MKKQNLILPNSKLLITLTFLIVVSISVFNFSCKKSERELKKEASFENLSKDKDFMSLLKMNTDFLDQIPNLKGAVEIYKSKTENGSSFHKLATDLGFNNKSEYLEFFNEQERYKMILNAKYDFESLSKTDKMKLADEISLIISDYSVNLEVKNRSLRGKVSVVDVNGISTCSERRTSCNRSATATYTLEGLGCIGASALVGTGTFGLGGAVIYGICISAAAVHYDSMLNDCTYAYEDCMGIKPKLAE